MNVVSTPEGGFEVFAAGERLAGPFATNEEAWSYIDRQEGQRPTRRNPRSDTIEPAEVRKLAPRLFAARALNKWERRFVKDLHKKADRAVTSMLVSGPEADRWDKIKGRLPA